jgi:hypothetical protein
MNCEFQLVPVPRHLPLCPYLSSDGLYQTTPSCYHTRSELALHRLHPLCRKVGQLAYASRRDVKVATMELSSLNVDVLLHMIKFLHPDDRLNLVISGILKGFENFNEGIDLRQRYSGHFTCDVSGNLFVICPESKELKLNWGNVEIARAS